VITLRQLIFYSSIFGIFSGAFFFLVGTVHILIFYFVMTLNLVLMTLLGRLWLPKGLIALVVFISISGIVGVNRGTDTVGLFAKELIGITFSAVYFCAFIRLMEFDVDRCFRAYARLAFYVASFGVVFLPFQIVYLQRVRLQSIFSEPAAFAEVCLPAFFYYADRWQRRLGGGKEVLVFLLAFALARSSVGFLGILFGLFLFGKRYRYRNLVFPVLILVTGLGIYSASSDFRLRLNDSLKSAGQLDVKGVNISTFVLVSNVFVTEQVLLEHPLMGGGLGSHFVSHERFLGDLANVELFDEEGITDLNAYDANSLFLRVLSEMGAVGIILVFWFIWRYRVSGTDDRAVICQALWIYFSLKLLRGGVYFNPEQFFFIVLYAVNGRATAPGKSFAALPLISSFQEIRRRPA